MHRIIGLLLLLSLSSIVQAKEKTGPFALSGGCITSATVQYVVLNTLPTAITATVASGGSCTSYSYQWQKSTDNVYFTDIPGATAQNLSFTAAPAVTTYYQRRTTCGTEIAYTGSVVVNMIARFYFNVADTAVYTRDNCGTGTPQPYSYIVPANKYKSPFSQQDADAKAQKDLTDSGMYYARLRGVCLWYNAEKKDTLNRNNCGTGFGSSYIYIVRARKYTSSISQPDADAKAQKDINDSTQYYANKFGTCTWYNVARDSTTTKKDCPAGTTPTSYKYIVPAGKYFSTISQPDADAKASKDIKDSTQLKANANAACQNLFISIRSDGGTDPGYFNISVTNSAGVVVYQRSALDGDFLPLAVALPSSPSYTVSVASPGPMYTIVNGTTQKFTNNSSASWSTGTIIKVEVSLSRLWYNDYASKPFKKDCPDGYTGSIETYSVMAEKYSSPIGLVEANAKAQEDIDNNGQAYANRVGTCTPSQLVSITLTNQFSGLTSPPSPHTVSFIKDGIVVQTVNFPSTVTGSANVMLPAGTYTMTFSTPNLPTGYPLGWNLRPQDYYWSKPSNSNTFTTGPVTFVYGTAYTIYASRDL